ncbi:MAG: hypothetical protein EAX81_06200 [Candidatus Thorarchaeota archaeon]|nr:hypothetical protein [Candidatus Thorarchaeota archaeon]
MLLDTSIIFFLNWKHRAYLLYASAYPIASVETTFAIFEFLVPLLNRAFFSIAIFTYLVMRMSSRVPHSSDSSKLMHIGVLHFDYLFLGPILLTNPCVNQLSSHVSIQSLHI